MEYVRPYSRQILEYFSSVLYTVTTKYRYLIAACCALKQLQWRAIFKKICVLATHIFFDDRPECTIWTRTRKSKFKWGYFCLQPFQSRNASRVSFERTQKRLKFRNFRRWHPPTTHCVHITRTFSTTAADGSSQPAAGPRYGRTYYPKHLFVAVDLY